MGLEPGRRSCVKEEECSRSPTEVPGWRSSSRSPRLSRPRRRRALGRERRGARAADRRCARARPRVRAPARLARLLDQQRRCRLCAADRLPGDERRSRRPSSVSGAAALRTGGRDGELRILARGALPDRRDGRFRRGNAARSARAARLSRLPRRVHSAHRRAHPGDPGEDRRRRSRVRCAWRRRAPRCRSRLAIRRGRRR